MFSSYIHTFDQRKDIPKFIHEINRIALNDSKALYRIYHKQEYIHICTNNEINMYKIFDIV